MSLPGEIASFGHSATQLPQLMQSDVMWVAMGRVTTRIDGGNVGGQLPAVKTGHGRRAGGSEFWCRAPAQGNSAPEMSFRRELWASVACLVLPVLGACQPKIGDDCNVSSDCGSGARVCDVTQPSGYCTIYNCEPGSCPSESICVAFHVFASVTPGCEDPQGSSRLARSFCMRRCTGRSDCRGAYACVDVNTANNPWSATVLEEGKQDGRVCIVPYAGPALSSDVDTEVCWGSDGGFDALPAAPPPDAEAPADAASEGSD
jgi:hypothetical protein